MDNQWMDHPSLAGIDRQKLELLQSLVDQGTNKNQNDLMGFFMNLTSAGGIQGLHFTKEEMQLIVNVIKKDKPAAEAARLEKIIRLMSMIKR